MTDKDDTASSDDGNEERSKLDKIIDIVLEVLGLI